jgi:hypothetical protein
MRPRRREKSAAERSTSEVKRLSGWWWIAVGAVDGLLLAVWRQGVWSEGRLSIGDLIGAAGLGAVFGWWSYAGWRHYRNSCGALEEKRFRIPLVALALYFELLILIAGTNLYDGIAFRFHVRWHLITYGIPMVAAVAFIRWAIWVPDHKPSEPTTWSLLRANAGSYGVLAVCAAVIAECAALGSFQR